jgi:hypothetical protein
MKIKTIEQRGPDTHQRPHLQLHLQLLDYILLTNDYNIEDEINIKEIILRTILDIVSYILIGIIIMVIMSLVKIDDTPVSVISDDSLIDNTLPVITEQSVTPITSRSARDTDEIEENAVNGDTLEHLSNIEGLNISDSESKWIQEKLTTQLNYINQNNISENNIQLIINNKKTVQLPVTGKDLTKSGLIDTRRTEIPSYSEQYTEVRRPNNSISTDEIQICYKNNTSIPRDREECTVTSLTIQNNLISLDLSDTLNTLELTEGHPKIEIGNTKEYILNTLENTDIHYIIKENINNEVGTWEIIIETKDVDSTSVSDNTNNFPDITLYIISLTGKETGLNTIRIYIKQTDINELHRIYQNIMN